MHENGASAAQDRDAPVPAPEERPLPRPAQSPRTPYRRRYGAYGYGTAPVEPEGSGAAALRSFDYSHIRRDLRRIALLSAAMFAVLVILSFVLR